MKVVYFSKGIRGSLCLERILEEGYPVSAVIGVAPEDQLEQLSKENNFPIFYPEKINTKEVINHLKSFQPDLFILCGYNKILKMPVIEIPLLGTINLHGGKLPEYRGAAPINWQIINGETSGGCSIIYVDEGIDTGDIIAQEIYSIKPDDTHASILEKTLEIFPRLLVQVLEQIESGTTQVHKQDPLAGSYYSRRYPRDSRIDWTRMTDIQVHNLVRGMHGPYPAAFTYRNDTKVEIDRTELLEETITGIPGRVPQKRGRQVVVLAKNRGLVIIEITVDGEKLDPSSFFKIGDDLR
jgi:methionyl-tRNA formyltransferase